MAWRNLWRHGRRTAITATAMAVSIGFVLGLYCFTDGTYVQMSRIMVDDTTGHVILRHPGYPASRSLTKTVGDASARIAALDALPGLRGVSYRLYGAALVAVGEKTVGAQLVGVEPARERARGATRLVAGRELGEAPAREIVLGAGLAHTLRAELGSEAVVVTQAADGSLGNELYTVVGIASSGAAMLDRAGAWVHVDDLRSLLVLPDQVHEISLLAASEGARVDDPAVVGLRQAALAAVGGVRPVPPPAPGAAMTAGSTAPTTPGAAPATASAAPAAPEVATWWEAQPMLVKMLGMSDVSGYIVLGVVFGVAGMGVLNTMLMSVFERTRELGVMKALGTRPRFLVRLVLLESLQLGLLSMAGGLVLGGLLDLYLIRVGMRFSVSDGEGFSAAGVLFDPVVKGAFRGDRVVLTAASLLVVALLAALWPALRAAGLRPVEAMRDR